MLSRLLRLIASPSDKLMSAAWIRRQRQRDLWPEYHSRPLRWPIDKLANDEAWRNRHRLRRSA